MSKKKSLNVRSKSKQRKARVRTKAKKRPTPSPHRDRAWNLGTLPAVRRRLAAIVTDLDHMKFRSALGISRARSMIYGLSTIAGILKSELELALEREVIERLAAIERRMEGV